MVYDGSFLMKPIPVLILTGVLCGASSPLFADAKRQELIFMPGAGIQLADPEVSNLNNNVESFLDDSAYFGAQYLWDANARLVSLCT